MILRLISRIFLIGEKLIQELVADGLCHALVSATPIKAHAAYREHWSRAGIRTWQALSITTTALRKSLIANVRREIRRFARPVEIRINYRCSYSHKHDFSGPRRAKGIEYAALTLTTIQLPNGTCCMLRGEVRYTEELGLSGGRQQTFNQNFVRAWKLSANLELRLKLGEGFDGAVGGNGNPIVTLESQRFAGDKNDVGSSVTSFHGLVPELKNKLAASSTARVAFSDMFGKFANVAVDALDGFEDGLAQNTVAKSIRLGFLVHHSESVLPVTPPNQRSPTSLTNLRLTPEFQPPTPPLCMNIRHPRLKGWQLLSARAPSVLARTRVRLLQFQAGMVEVKMHGSGPSRGRRVSKRSHLQHDPSATIASENGAPAYHKPTHLLRKEGATAYSHLPVVATLRNCAWAIKHFHMKLRLHLRPSLALNIKLTPDWLSPQVLRSW
ncbi:hypothetical protein KCU90_g168, partial [Aureobasidium melanogenum]